MTESEFGTMAAPEVVITFLRGIMPFKELDAQVLHEVARHVRVDFFPKGTWLLTMGETEVRYLYLIQQGGVKSFLTDDEGQTTLKDYRGDGEYIGALGIIRGTVANMNVETVEDTFCFLLPREVFLELINSQPGFAQYYLKSFSEKVVTTAYTELRKHRVGRRSEEDLFLFSIKTGDIIGGRLRALDARASVRDAATKMMQFSVGSLLIYERKPDNIIGIVTDKDLRNKVVAAELDAKAQVRAIMTAPVVTIDSQTVCFDALIQMMSKGIHHLAVEEAGKVIGVITSHDIMLLQGNSPYILFKEIGRQQQFPALYSLAQKIPDVIRSLLNEGAKASNISRMIALLNDHLLRQVLRLVEKELGRPPLPYCWILVGSEGRREQTFKTDQDNALVYADPKDDQERIVAEEYFAEFSKRIIDRLVNCGYPTCAEGIMASNPRWCQPLQVWKDYFATWLRGERPDELLRAAVFFDFRGIHGQRQLAEELRSKVINLAKHNRGYIRAMVNDSLVDRAPLSVFRDVVIEQDGKQASQFNIKGLGLAPFIKFARILALRYGIRETNTQDRLAVLAQEGHLDKELMEKALEAFEIQMHLRLIHQMHQREEGVMPDNTISPGELSELEKKMLRDAFETAGSLKSILQDMVSGQEQW